MNRAAEARRLQLLLAATLASILLVRFLQSVQFERLVGP